VAKTKIDKIPSLRISRKIGRLDGREGLPDLTVSLPRSPFLLELKSVGEQHITQVTQSRTERLSNFDDDLATNIANQAALERNISDISSDIASHEDELNRLKVDYRGKESDSESSRVSDRRYLDGYLYFIIIAVTIVGEVVITYPAFTEMFQDAVGIAVLATIAASAMTISYSHILGLSLKRNDDKKRRQPRWVMPTLLTSSIPVLGLVYTLSNVRAAKFKEDPTLDLKTLSESGSLEGPGLGESSNGLQDIGAGNTSQVPSEIDLSAPLSFITVFLLFAFLQLALMTVATFASYHHFSNSLAEEKRLTILLKKLRKKLGKSIARKVKLEKSFENAGNKRSEIHESHKAQAQNIHRKTSARSQAFWGANIRQRSDSPLAKSRDFPPPDLELPDWM
jgi:hypothetical protein